MHPAATPFLAVRALAQRVADSDSDYDALLDMAHGRDFLLLGEATHGTQDFYRMRARITQHLISAQGFDAVAIEGDWPDTWRVNQFVQSEGAWRDEADADAALDDFRRFPVWMWRNREMRDFIIWLRAHNAGLGTEQRVGVYGLDLYSMYQSADAVVRYLERVDPAQAELARERYAALDHVREPQAYGYAAAVGARRDAREGVVAQLLQLRADALLHLLQDGLAALDAQFFAQQNAEIVVDAEQYYRSMFGRRLNTWNLRDAHMYRTLGVLARYRRQRGGSGRTVVWAHNSHVGDGRACESHVRGEWNLGQLVREATGAKALLVGFTTYTGHVSAASRWDGDVEHKWVRPALHDSYEYLFHSTGLDRFFLPLQGIEAEPLREAMLERAIGVIYLPQTERESHYFWASMANQFDAVFHLDETSAVEPLDVPGHWHEREEPERAA